MKNYNEITRFISASLHRNSGLRSFVKNLLKEKYKAVNFSFGIDYEAILKHYSIAKKKRTQELWFFFMFYIIAFAIGVILLNSVEESFFSIFITIGILWLCSHLYYKGKNKFLVRNYNKENFGAFTNDLKVDDFDQKKIDKLIQRIDGNVCYYGGYSPDENLGSRLRTWSFAIDLEQKKDKTIPITDFESTELYNAIVSKISDVFPSIQINDKLFGPGNQIRHNSDFLPNPLSFPKSSLEDNEFSLYKNGKDKFFRYYKTFQVSSWENELTLTFLLKIKKSKKYIFVESSYLFFPPLKKKFKEIDELIFVKSVPRGESKFNSLSGEPFIKIFTNFFEILGEILFVLGEISSAFDFSFTDEDEKNIKNNYNYNYGEITNLRKLISADIIENYFILSDLDEYTKIFEKRLLDVLSNFLEEKNIDVSEFKQRENNILNNGIIITGGQIQADNLSVGKKSKIQPLSIKPLESLNK